MFFIRAYQNISRAKPAWSRARRWQAVLTGTWCFIRHRFWTVLFLLTGYFPYQTRIVGQAILDRHYRDGAAVFFSTHAGPYPLTGRILQQHYPDQKLVVPFFHEHKITSVYPIFRRLFPRLGITVIRLGGAMRTIGPILDAGGSVCLFLDAVLPVKHTRPVKLFGRTIDLTTGPLWLARERELPIIPVHTTLRQGVVTLHVGEPIDPMGDVDQTLQRIADDLQTLIESDIMHWQPWDKFLLRD